MKFIRICNGRLTEEVLKRIRHFLEQTGCIRKEQEMKEPMINSGESDDKCGDCRWLKKDTIVESHGICEINTDSTDALERAKSKDAPVCLPMREMLKAERERNQALVALATLADKLDVITECDAFKSVFTMAAIHGQPYSGPNFGEELAAARMLLKRMSCTKKP